MPTNNIAIIEPNLRKKDEQIIFYTRADFLSRLGLVWDPFIKPVAEHELIHATDQVDVQVDAPLPLAYFEPPTGVEGERILPALRRSSEAYVFGDPGMGKTSLRLALDAICRRVPDGTLVVTHLMRDNMPEAPTVEVHAAHLSQALAIDLFLQVLEQFVPGVTVPTDRQLRRLGQLVALAGRPLQRLAQAILQRPIPERMMGLAHHWHLVDRLPVRHVAPSPELFTLVQTVLNISHEEEKLQPGFTAWQLGIETARLWGFHQIFVLVDGVDTWFRTPGEMFALIEPLLRETIAWRGQSIYGKYYLPLELKERVQQFQQKYHPHIEPAPYTFDLHWDEAGLRRLLAARFRAGKSRHIGFNDLVDPDWGADLDQLLVETANRCPRRLLKLISTLIDKHIAAWSTDLMTTCAPPLSLSHDTFMIREHEWRQTLQALSGS